MGVSLRSALDEDVDAVLALWAVGAENDSRPADSAAAVRRLVERDPDALVLALSESGDVVGSVVAGWDGWRAHLYRLAVHPDARRGGVGRALLAEAERRLVALGAIRVDAMVLDDNEQAHRIWRACGYQPQDEWSRWIKPL